MALWVLFANQEATNMTWPGVHASETAYGGIHDSFCALS